MSKNTFKKHVKFFWGHPVLLPYLINLLGCFLFQYLIPSANEKSGKVIVSYTIDGISESCLLMKQKT